MPWASLRPRQGSFPATSHTEEGLLLHLPSFLSAAVPLLSSISNPTPTPASPLQSLSCGWSSSGPVVGPFGVGGNVEAYLEQRVCGLRKTSPHFPSHLHLSGLWATQVTRPACGLRTARAQMPASRMPISASHLASAVCSRLAALGEDPPGTVETAQRKEVHRVRR